MDYPNHLASVFVLAHLNDTRFVFNHFYGAEWRPYPNLATELMLLGLQHFMSIELAGRIVLSISALSVPLGAWTFLREANPGESSLSLWALLIAYNPFFIFGFMNNQLSIGLCFFVVGLWLRYMTHARPFQWMILLALVTGLYFTHLGGFAVAGLVISAYILIARRSIRLLLLSWLLFLPGAICLISVHQLGYSGWIASFASLANKIRGLPMGFVGYSTAVDVIICATLVCCIPIAIWRNSSFSWNKPWLAISILFLALYFVFPRNYGTLDADLRLTPFLFVLALATVKVGPSRGRLLGALAILAFVLRLSDTTYNFLREQPKLEVMEHAIEVIPQNARVLPIVEGRPDPTIKQGYQEFWAYGVIRRGWYTPYLFSRRDIHVLRIRYEGYAPYQDPQYNKTLDWARIRKDYDYLWAYNVPQFWPRMNSIGDVTFSDGVFRVIRLNKGPNPSGDPP
jgi:hypothetical protein